MARGATPSTERLENLCYFLSPVDVVRADNHGNHCVTVQIEERTQVAFDFGCVNRALVMSGEPLDFVRP